VKQPAPSRLRNFSVLCSLGANTYRRSQLTRMAAALSYRTIFGLIPVFVIGLVVLHRFLSQERLRALITDVLQFSGLTQVVVDETPAEKVSAVPGLNLFGGLAVVKEKLPRTDTPAARLDEWITALLERIDDVNFGALGIAGAITLGYAALAMVVEIEKAFNQIAMVDTGKGWVRRITQYWALLTLGPLLLVASFWVRDAASDLFGGPGEKLFSLSQIPFYLLTVLISTLLLVIIYTSVPNTKVRIRAAFMGAAAAAVLWEASKWAFTAYVSYSTGYARLYGVIALLPLFLIWVYVTWIIALVGFQITMTLQHYRTLSREGFRRSVMRALGLEADEERNPTQAHLEGGVVLTVAAACARVFGAGAAFTPAGLAAMTRLDEAAVKAVLERFAQRGLLHRVANAEDGYTLARAPEAVTAIELLDAVHPRPESAVARMAWQQRRDALDGMTMADLRKLDWPDAAILPSTNAEPPADAPPAAPTVA